MWPAIIQMLISFAIKFGIPWLLKMFPGISPDTMAIVKEAVDKRKKVSVDAEEKIAKATKTTLTQNQSQSASTETD